MIETKLDSNVGSYLNLLNITGGDEKTDSNPNKGQSNNDEQGQHNPSRQDGLPGRQSLLGECCVIRFTNFGILFPHFETLGGLKF